MSLKSEPPIPANDCFTCLRQSDVFIPIISGNDLNGSRTAKLLAKHFWFQPSDFNAEHGICADCWNQLNDFDCFYQKVEKNHRHYDYYLGDYYELKEASIDDELVEQNNTFPKGATIDDELKFNQKAEQNHGFHIKPSIANKMKFNSIDLLIADEIQHDELIVKHELEEEELRDDTDSIEKTEQLRRLPTEQLRRLPTEQLRRLPTEKSKRISRKCRKEIAMSTARKAEIIKSHVRYICIVCQKDCKTFTWIKKHMVIEHGMKGCVTCCGKEFTLREHLLVHVLRVTNSKNSNHLELSCNRCHEQFATVPELKWHVNMHEIKDNKIYKCEQCQKTFSFLYILYRHIKRVHGAESFRCDICDKGFKTGALLQQHKERHEASNDVHRCDVCETTFTDFNAFLGHKKVHTGPLECTVCGEVLGNEVALIRHKWFRHRQGQEQGGYYICNLCDTKCKYKASFSNHLRKQHPLNEEKNLLHKNSYQFILN